MLLNILSVAQTITKKNLRNCKINYSRVGSINPNLTIKPVCFEQLWYHSNSESYVPFRKSMRM